MFAVCVRRFEMFARVFVARHAMTRCSIEAENRGRDALGAGSISSSSSKNEEFVINL